jgi:hypothetical protein
MTDQLQTQRPFEIALEMVEYYKGWIDWDNPSDVIKKLLLSAIYLLRISNLGELIPGVLKYFEARSGKNYNEHD